MKNIFLTCAAAMLSLLCSPAFAQTEPFEGPRIGVLIGISGDSSPFDDAEFTYGAAVGYDLAVGDNFLIGVEADVSSVSLNTGGFNVDNRQFSVGVRGTVPVTQSTALFVSGGYTNLEFSSGALNVNFDGFRIGAGGEYKVTSNLYVNTEYRYSEYSLGGFDLGSAGVQSALVGVGLRF